MASQDLCTGEKARRLADQVGRDLRYGKNSPHLEEHWRRYDFLTTADCDTMIPEGKFHHLGEGFLGYRVC